MTADRSPTDRQMQVLAFIRAFRDENDMPPTRAEIARHFGWASANAAEEVLQRLQDHGLIQLRGGIARGIRVMA